MMRLLSAPMAQGERGLGTYRRSARRRSARRLLGQRVQHHVPPHRDLVRTQHRLLGRDQRPAQRDHHRGQVTPGRGLVGRARSGSRRSWCWEGSSLVY